MSKTVLITGATGGLGRGLVEVYLENDFVVYALARNDQKINDLKSDFPSKRLNPISIDFESADESQLIEALREINKLDILINNAALFLKKDLKDISLADFEKVYKINVYMPFLLVKNLIEPLSKSNSGQVINVGSVGGVNGTLKYEELLPYSSSKGALGIMSECLAEDLSKYNIRSNCLAFGALNTEMLKKAFPKSNGTSAKDASIYIFNFSQNSIIVNGKTHILSLSNP